MAETLTTMLAIGERIARIRDAYGLEASEFARFVGWSPQALNNYEKGHRRPDLDQTLKLCRKTGATLDYIYQGHEWTLPARLISQMDDPGPAARSKA